MKRTKFYLVVIADYNDDDAHGVVHDNLYYWFDYNDLTILEYDRVDVRPFNTVQTGYILARRALNPLSPSDRQVFFVNTAPRMDKKEKRATNQGEGFVLAELYNGKKIFAVTRPRPLSIHMITGNAFIRSKAMKLRGEWRKKATSNALATAKTARRRKLC